MKVFTAFATRAAAQCGFARRSVHCDTTSQHVYGDYRVDDARQTPFTLPYGYRKDTRPDRKQFVLSTLCVDRAVPIWSRHEDGNASEKTINTTVRSEISQIMARYGVAPGAYVDIADAAMVSEAHRNALGKTLFMSRLPATYTECARLIPQAVAAQRWHEVGVLAQSKPTKNRPATVYRLWESPVSLHGPTSRAVVVHSSSLDCRRQKRLEGACKTSNATLETKAKEATKLTYLCHGDAMHAAAELRMVSRASHGLEGDVEERPPYGPGRPRATQPRAVKALHYGLNVRV